MAIEIPTTEPARVRAGDTVTWRKSLALYPATDGWTLYYRLINATAKIDITATASGSDHLVSLTSTITAAYTAGNYDYLAWAEKGTGPTYERASVGSGRITITPNLAALNTYDGRSDARRIYESLLAAYETATTSRAYVAEYEIAGRRMKFNAKSDWITELNYWKAQVAAEDRAAALAAGLGGGSARLLVRF